MTSIRCAIPTARRVLARSVIPTRPRRSPDGPPRTIVGRVVRTFFQAKNAQDTRSLMVKANVESALILDDSSGGGGGDGGLKPP
eukprot:CAMPEP_0198205658 /NCGR_PEP_ID=MMETSP1445-20131203/9192_1 /TAXON_ID=36898 /ORGANISM="Pyramimonas sp., Strain CCMP2087" /LENGTH=83 /DNA_ID=CAMNT_0043878037 /DNA_START=206 /DNA_END=453 /DNA_ORIENTATION=+